jgi:segregation and condensation protein B
MEAAIEAILFVATEPVSNERLYSLFGDDDRAGVDAALEAVIARYPGTAAQGLVADFAAGGVRLVTRPALQGWLRRFFQVTGRTKLSMAALETLAIVAYRQPITAPEIQELRSVSSTGVLKTLLDHRLVRISGRKEVVGKPFLYSTSREFLVRFGLNKLQDLPPLEDFEQMLQTQADAEAGTTSEQRTLDLGGPIDAEAELDAAERAEEKREEREREPVPMAWSAPESEMGEDADRQHDRDERDRDEDDAGVILDDDAPPPESWDEPVSEEPLDDDTEPSVAAIDWIEDGGLPEEE